MTTEAAQPVAVVETVTTAPAPTKGKVTEAWIVTEDKHEIFTKVWHTPSDPIAAVVFVHGFGEHILRYDHVFEEFSQAGFQVSSFDQRGFGQTGKKSKSNGVTGGYAKVIPDITAALERGRIAGKPLFLMGHSYGGSLVLNYACSGPLRNQLAGVIASAPLITISGKYAPNAATVGFAGAVAKVFPSLQIPVSLDVKYISRSEDEVKRYQSDPLVHGVGSTRGIYDMLTNAKALLTVRHQDFPENLPLLVCHGSGDGITDHDSSKLFCERATGVKDKEFKSWEGYYHELHNDEEKEEVIAYYVAWLKKRV